MRQRFFCTKWRVLMRKKLRKVKTKYKATLAVLLIMAIALLIGIANIAHKKANLAREKSALMKYAAELADENAFMKNALENQDDLSVWEAVARRYGMQYKNEDTFSINN